MINEIFIFPAISVDYDLYFSDPLRSSAAQVVPFDTGSTDSLTIAMWVQYTQQDEGGVFFTAYSVRFVKIQLLREIQARCVPSIIYKKLYVLL